MRSVNVIHENPYELFNYYRVWFEVSKVKVPMIDGKPMLLLYMGAECDAPCELPKPIVGVPNAFTYELPKPEFRTIVDLLDKYYIYGAFYNRNQLNAPEERILRGSVEELDVRLEAIENVQRWTYSTVRGLKNMTPPLLPPRVPLYNTSTLKAYAMNLEYDKTLLTQAKVGNEQYWNMGATVGQDVGSKPSIVLDHPQVDTQMSVPIGWLIKQTGLTDPEKILLEINRQMEVSGESS